METVWRPCGDRVRQVNGSIRNELDLAAGRIVSAGAIAVARVNGRVPLQQQNTATLPDGINLIRPAQTHHLLGRPASTSMRLVHTEEVTSHPARPASNSCCFPLINTCSSEHDHRRPRQGSSRTRSRYRPHDAVVRDMQRTEPPGNQVLRATAPGRP